MEKEARAKLFSEAEAHVKKFLEKLGLEREELCCFEGKSSCFFSVRYAGAWQKVSTLPVAIITENGLLRFFIPNNKGVLEIVDLVSRPTAQKEQKGWHWRSPGRHGGNYL